MIAINNFSKNYNNLFSNGSSFAVQDVNLQVAPGQICGLLGPNGSGKTTIMKAICGFHYPSSGQILVDDNNGNFIDVAQAPEKAKELIGYLPEKSILPPEMVVLDFLNFAASIHELSGEKKDKAIKNVINECALEKVLTKKIKTLSKGYSQRVSFAQAIIHNPPNLILDEPVSGLDPAQIIQMRKLISKLAETKSVLLSTHLLQEVYSLCKSICIISNGKITAKGNEEEVLEASGCKNLEDAFMKLTSQSE